MGLHVTMFQAIFVLLILVFPLSVVTRYYFKECKEQLILGPQVTCISVQL
jgi:hypothetical protein